MGRFLNVRGWSTNLIIVGHHFYSAWKLWVSPWCLSSFKRNPTICSMLATTHPGLHPFSLEKVQLSSSEHFPPGPKKTLDSGWEGCFLVSQSPHLFRHSRWFSFEFYRSGDLPPQSLTWNLKMMGFQGRNLLFQGGILRFHVKLQGCIRKSGCNRSSPPKTNSWTLIKMMKLFQVRSLLRFFQGIFFPIFSGCFLAIFFWVFLCVFCC